MVPKVFLSAPSHFPSTHSPYENISFLVLGILQIQNNKPNIKYTYTIQKKKQIYLVGLTTWKGKFSLNGINVLGAGI